MDCSLPGSSVHGIFQARILECIAIPFSRESSWQRDQTCVSCIGRQILHHWTPGKPIQYDIWAKLQIWKIISFFQNSYFYISKHFYAILLMICISLSIKYIYNLFWNSYQIYGESSHCFVMSIYFNKNLKFSFSIFNL